MSDAATVTAPAAATEPAAPALSVVVSLGRDDTDVTGTYAAYKAVLAPLGSLEFVYVLDGPQPASRAALRTLRQAGEPVEILAFARPFGKAAALTVGLRQCRGETVLTLPAVPEIAAADLPRFVRGVQAGEADMLVAHRMLEGKPLAPKLEWALRLLVQSPFHDVRSEVRAMRAQVAQELTFYGNQDRFLPLIASAHGFAVKELDVHVPAGSVARLHQLRTDPSLFLDVVTLFFLLKFMRKPFRFFGGVGFGILGVGGLATAWLVFVRLVFGTPLADRPALILSSLMVVLGIQVIAVGLIGEIIAFAFAREIKDYKIDRVVD
ncbi:glycosyltransferase [Marinimicrococcus flavescens]|uniref:Glycosyltransferase n=1 Tax=Marinimicrococcus flavescens TaxID=3031815 RepID=A0AAP3V191_9PROT|nr:glycosyltransferase [Marinimicrococcus flavescens]